MHAASSELPEGLAGLRYGISQVSLAVRDLERTMARWHRAFGWAPWQVFDHVPPVHHATMLRGRPVHYALRGAEVYVGSLNFELLQPLEGPNLWSEFLDRRGEGIASIATMFLEREEGDAVKAAFRERFGIEVSMRAEIGDHIEYYYLDTESRFGCLIESGSGHAIDFVRPARVHPHPGAEPGPSPVSGIDYRITQVSLTVTDLEARAGAFREAFGWGPWRVYEPDGPAALRASVPGDPAAAIHVRLAQATVGDLNVELVEPVGDGGPWADFLAAKGEGIQSIGVTVASDDVVEGARRQFEADGIGVLASASVGGRPWLLLDTDAELACQVGVGTGHASDRLAPSSVIGE